MVGHNLYIEYDSFAEFVAGIPTNHSDKYPPPVVQRLKEYDNVWAGGTWAQALEYARNGDLAFTPGALEAISNVHGLDRELVTAPVGFAPCVPAFLANSPASMLSYENTRESEAAPIRIYIGISSSAGIAASALRQRGEMIAAIVAQTQNERPVDLYVFQDSQPRHAKGDCLIVVKLTTNPPNLSELGAVLAQPCVKRQLFHAEVFHEGLQAFGGTVSSNLPFGSEPIPLALAKLGHWTADSDVIIPPALLLPPSIPSSTSSTCQRLGLNESLLYDNDTDPKAWSHAVLQEIAAKHSCLG